MLLTLLPLYTSCMTYGSTVGTLILVITYHFSQALALLSCHHKQPPCDLCNLGKGCQLQLAHCSPVHLGCCFGLCSERVRQKKELDLVMGERDILGTQLIRRNDELALLYEKVKIQQSTLSRGQMQYRDRLNEIRVLKIKLADLKRELHVLRTGVANVDVLKREVASLGRQLLQERTKVKALSEELENPLNVHRWRKLEGSDPSTYEMIQKIQTLQKRLIGKTEEVVEKELLIQEKEKLYVELKSILARQPGPEVAEQLSMYQASLRDKTKQLKAMASELNMYQAQVAEYKYEIERLTRELGGLKKKYFESKKREQLEKEAQRGAAAAAGALPGSKTAPVGSPQQQRFTGGGFSLSTVVTQ
eukprot:GHRR01015590.1.p1 GENE.GHRR01015590.1~~GHRR01015590.1.p1  ORF type:complete len:361 (+),score=108.58 GHRR01015590.1:380-1462(+)